MTTPHSAAAAGQRAHRAGLPHGRAAALRRWSEQRKAAGKLLGEILVELDFCTEDQVIECLATGLRRALRQARAAAGRSEDRRRAAAGVHREEPRLAAVHDSRHADGRGLRAVEPVPDRRAAQPDAAWKCRSCATSAKDIRRMITTLPDSKMFVIDDIIEDNAAGRSHADRRRRSRTSATSTRIRRPIAGHPPGQLHHLQRGQGRGQRHPHRAGRALHAGPLPHRRPALQVARSAAATCSAPSPAASRSWPRSTSASGGCRRTAACTCCSTAARSTSASARFPAAAARRP